MSKVIKAGFARMIPIGEGDRFLFRPAAEPQSPSGQEDSFQPEEGPAPCISSTELQAAYDELIATAQDEVVLLLEDARGEAQSIFRAAENEAEQIRNAAYSEGYEEGLARSRDEMEELLASARRQAEDILDEAERTRQRVIQETEPKLMKLSFDIAEKILRCELDRNEQAFMKIVANALDNVRDDKSVILHVNPAEYAGQFGSRDTAKIRTPGGNVTARVSVDPTVEEGGCIIETESGMIDTSISAQMGQVSHALGFDDL